MRELKTLSDYFDPIQARQQVAALRAQEQRNQMNELAMQQQAEKQQAMQEYLSGNQPGSLMQALQPVQQQPEGTVPMPQQTPGQQQMTAPASNMPDVAQQQPLPPEMSDEEKQVIRGQKKIKNIVPLINSSFSSTEISGAKINKLSKIANSDKDIQAAVKKAGYDSIDFGYDEDEGKAWQRYTKTWTKEELDNIASKVPGGKVLSGLPEGKYTLEYDPINNRIMPMVKGGAVSDDTGIGKMNTYQLIDKAQNSTTAEERNRYSDILSEKQRMDVSVAQAKVMATSAPPFASWDANEQQNAYESFMLNKTKPMFARGDKFSKSQFTRGYNKYLEDLGISPAEAEARGIEYRSLGKSFSKMQGQLNSMEQFVGSLDAQLERIDPLFSEISRFDTRALNIPIVKLKTQFKGSEIERELAFKIEEVWNDAARIAGGSTESIGQLDVATQDRYRKIFDPSLSINGLKRLMTVAQDSAHDRLDSIVAVKDQTLQDMKNLTTKSGISKKQPKSKGRFRILAVE